MYSTSVKHNSLSSSTIVTPMIEHCCLNITLLGRESSSIVRMNVSFPSTMSSSVIEILTGKNVSPAGIVKLYGPGS